MLRPRSRARAYLKGGLSSDHARNVREHKHADEGVAVVVEVNDLRKRTVRRSARRWRRESCIGADDVEPWSVGSHIPRKSTHVVLGLSLVSVGHLLVAREVGNSNTELLGLGGDGSQADAILSEFSELIVRVSVRSEEEQEGGARVGKGRVSGSRRLEGNARNSPELNLHAVEERTGQLKVDTSISALLCDSHRDEINTRSFTDGGDDLGRRPGSVNEGGNVLGELAAWWRTSKGEGESSANGRATRRRPRFEPSTRRLNLERAPPHLGRQKCRKRR